MKAKWVLPIVSALVASVAVVAVVISLDFPSKGSAVEIVQVNTAHFSEITGSLEQLTEYADVVVIGNVTEVVQSGIDRGRDGDGSGIPMTLYKVEVLETLKGEVDATIYVYRTDPGYFDDPVTKLGVGEKVVLYVEEVSATYAPNVTVTDTIYVPIALDNGVFDVVTADGAVGVVSEDTVVRPRGISPAMFAEGTEFTAAQIRAAIEPDSGEEGPTGTTH